MELVKEKPKTKKPKKESVSRNKAFTALEIKKTEIGKKDKFELSAAAGSNANLSLVVNENYLKRSEEIKDSSNVLSTKTSPADEKIISENLSQINIKNEVKGVIQDSSSISPPEMTTTNEKSILNNSQFCSKNNVCNYISVKSSLLEEASDNPCNEVPTCLSNETVCLYPKAELKIKEESSVVLQDKDICNTVWKNVLSASDSRTQIPNVYPKLKSIQQYEKIEDIESMRAIVQNYAEEYTSKTYRKAIKRCQEFPLAVTGIENYSLFQLTKEYQNSRKLSNEAQMRLKYLNSKLTVEKANLWKLIKKETSSKGCCEDGYTVAVSKTYHVKELDKTKFNEITDFLRELEEVVLSHAFYSYSDELSKMKIDQYVYNMINYINSSNSDGFNKKDVLKKCISVLFHYQRQSTKDKSFLKKCQKWLKLLVFVLLQNADESDYLFIVDHIIRCPNGIKAWASQLLQFPGSSLCTKETKDYLGCPCLYYALLVLYLILNPAPDRDNFLRNVKSNAADHTDVEFTCLASDGEEEELFEVVRNWTNEDIISLLNQISIASLFEHILFERSGDSREMKSPSKERIIKIFAFSTSLVNILFSGLTSYCKEEFSTSVECICSMIRHVVFYVSDHWEYCEKLDIPSKSALQAEYDRFIFHTIYIIFNFEKLGVWKYLATLPYKCVSKKMLWNILWIFHSSKSSEEKVYFEKDVDLKLNDDHMISTFLEKLSAFDDCDQIYLLSTYKSISLLGNPEEAFLCFIVHEIFEVLFGKNSMCHLRKEGVIVLSSIVETYPDLLTTLLKEVEMNADGSINESLVLFEKMDLSRWIPKCDDIRFIREWLLELPLSSPKNFLGRILLSKMNWAFSNQGKHILPLELHRETAVLVLEAYMKFDRKGNEWSVSNGLSQMLQFAKIGSYVREEEGFVPWAWDLLFLLKLHALDEKFPMWVQIYDGFLDIDFLPDPFEELWLQKLLNGYEEKHPVACYLFLVMTNIGHNVRRLMIEGLQCLAALVKNRQYLAAIQSLYYIIPFFVKYSEELLSKAEFINAMSDLIVADMTVLSNISGPVVGAVLHKIASMIKHQIFQASTLTVECATPLLKLWTSILLKVLSVHDEKNYSLKDSAKQVHFLLDVVVKIACIDSYTRNNMIDLLYSFGNPLLSTSSNLQPTFWSRLFGSNIESYTILRKQTLPDYPWLAWFVLKSETRQKQTQDLWFEIQKEIAKDSNITAMAALKKACNFLKIKQPPLESLPIYRWALQILQTPASHPVLPLLWQNFFYYFFERISILDSETCKSLGLNYFKNVEQFQILKRLKIQAQESAEIYKNCVQRTQDPEISDSNKFNTNEECIFNLQLCRIFRAFSFWIEETKLHQPSLCFSALGPKYCCEKLTLIFNKDQSDWFDLVSVDQLKDDLNQKVHSWVHKKKFSSSLSNSESHDKSSFERISRHLNNNEDVKPLECIETIHPPMQEIEDIALSSWDVLVKFIENKQSIIFDKARSFTDLSSKLKQLNSNYKNLVPQEFINQDHWETVSKSCHKNLKCTGAATFKLLVKQHFPNQRICEKLESNRMEHHMVQDQLLNLPINELCIASVHIENYISALSKKMETAEGEEKNIFRNLGVSLFYHQLEAVNKVIASVKNYTPSQNFFSTSIESLGNVFICNQEDQLCSLAKAILTYPEAGELAFFIFNPNVATITVFLELYEIITSAIEKYPLNTVFVLLHKIDLNCILKEKEANYCERRQLFKLICKALLECGSNHSKELQMVHHVLTYHFRFTLLWDFPEFYEDTISFILDGMEQNRLALSVWYEILHCFGCTTLNEESSNQAIENALKKYADNVLLPPDQQIFVSCRPLHVKEVLLTLERFHQKLISERNSYNIYEIYNLHVKPFGIFLAVLCHSILSILNENIDHKDTSNISQLWISLHNSFYPWLHPAQSKACFKFPWSDEKLDSAKFMFQMFSMCLRNFHDKLLGYNCEKCILSYLWSSYVDIYVVPELRHYSVALCHSEFLNLPWEEFHPNSEDLEGMCKILQSSLFESRDFLAKISLKIPWIEIMTHISETMSPEYVRNTLVTLGKLLIISGLDVSLTKSNLHQNNLKALENLSWNLISENDAESFLELYYSVSDPINLLNEEIQSNSDVCVLQFLKIVCCMVVSPNGVDYPHSNAKRLLFLHKFLTALTDCISDKKEMILKNPEKLQKVLPSLFTDIEKIIISEKEPEQQMCYALPLVKEVIGFLNKINNSKLQSMILDSILLWLKANPRSPLLLPCLQTACRSLNQMTSAVMIIECCISTRFNAEFHNPSEVHGIWQLILARFQIRSSMLDDFVHACINQNAFLTLYCYLLDKIPKTTSSESKKMLLMSIIDWINRCKVNENDEAKSLLLWDKMLELSIMLANEDNLQIVKTALSTFCRKLSIFGEDKSSDGFFGAVGFGRSSMLSVNFRFLCRIIVAFTLLQLPANASIRLQPMDPGLLSAAEMKNSIVMSSKSTEPSPSPAALDALKNVKMLLNNKPYSALRDLISNAIEFLIDANHTLSESRILLKEYALHVFPKHHYLYALG